jgi:hypothetical protein
MVINGL